MREVMYDQNSLLITAIILFALVTAIEAGHRPMWVTYTLALLIVILASIIIDLDRPRRGLIQVSQAPMLQLEKSLSVGDTTISQPP